MKMGYRKNLELNILRDVMKSADGIPVYRIPSRYKIEPKTLFLILNKYRNFIECKDGKVRVISGQRFALKQKYFPHMSADMRQRGIVLPSTFLGAQIGIDDFYFPRYLNNNQEELAF